MDQLEGFKFFFGTPETMKPSPWIWPALRAEVSLRRLGGDTTADGVVDSSIETGIVQEHSAHLLFEIVVMWRFRVWGHFEL
jgi:hypothetical protein